MRWTMESPAATVALTLTLDDAGRLRYSVDRHGRPLITPSRMGVERLDASFDTGLSVTEELVAQVRDERYTMAHGKARELRDHAAYGTIALRNPTGATLEVDVRVGDDAVAFRYRFPAVGPAEVSVTRELTTVTPAADGRVWAQSTHPVAAPAHENTYANGVPIGTASETSSWDMPALFEIDGQWLLVAESDLHSDYHGSRLGGVPDGRAYSLVGPDPREGRGVGGVTASATLPLALPWRVLAVADTAAQMLESTAVWHLAEPSRLDDASWVRPGRAAWSWWSQNASSTDPDAQRRFIDFAALMGWEYSLIDANWTAMGDDVIRELVGYAAERHVGLMLWYNSGGPHNAVTEQPRDLMHLPAPRRAELQRIADWGVSGIKVDFFESDKQEHIAEYWGILEDTAAVGLLVNFHGSTVPRGWDRTWPHLMTMEAVRGAEWYLIDPDFANQAITHNTILPFTRNVVGPMDYTPTVFSDRLEPRRTTAAHELAQTVAFQSSLLHLADAPDSYLVQDPTVLELLRAVPASWDRTVGLSGEPGDHVVVARLSGREWWVAGLCGPTPRPAELLSLERLGKDGPGQVHGDWVVVGDGVDRDAVQVSRPAPGPGLPLPAMATGGGFLARWRRTEDGSGER